MIINHVIVSLQNNLIYERVDDMISIAELRRKHGKISQRELAKKLDTTQASISNWEKNPLSMNAENIVKVALYFQISSDEILGINDEN